MRKPKILLPPRRPQREPSNALSAHPLRFAAVTLQGECLSEATVPRNALHQWMQAAKKCELGTLAWIGLHGVTRLNSVQAKDLARDLTALQQIGESIPNSLIET